MTDFEALRRFATRTGDPLAADLRRLLQEFDGRGKEIAWLRAANRHGARVVPPTTPPVNVDPRRPR